jgi:nitrate reductase (cytochrome), electron transfer subunit
MTPRRRRPPRPPRGARQLRARERREPDAGGRYHRGAQGEPGGLPLRVVGIIAVVAGMVGATLLLGPALLPGADEPAAPPPGSLVTGPPIPAEADVFRLRPQDLAAAPDVDRRREAHPRTMSMYRALRAYPGAPPRIPHGLTVEEFRGGRCDVCHERGGFVARFAAYAPVTPHPEMGACLQCHVADDALVGIDFPDTSAPGQVCFQCHLLDRQPPTFAALDWPAPAWPTLHSPALPGGPPTIPHGSQLRENCLACHMGAGAVEEIRTTHPERANCRQCHVPGVEAGNGEFTRSAASGRVAGGDS